MTDLTLILTVALAAAFVLVVVGLLLNNNLNIKRMKRYFLLAVFSLMVGICSAYDFSAVSPSGHTLYYNIDGSNVKVTSEIVVDLGTDAYETLPTGDLGIPETVTHDGVTYTVATIGDCARHSHYHRRERGAGGNTCV